MVQYWLIQNDGLNQQSVPCIPNHQAIQGASNQQAVIRRSQFHQSCAMFLLIHSLKNGSLKDTISPSTVLPNSNGFSIIIVSFFVIIECKDSNNLLSKNILVRTLLLINILVVILVNYLSIYCFLLKIY